MPWQSALRRFAGLHDYVPGEIPRALVRTPTWHGARGRGAGPVRLDAWAAHPVVARLVREHAVIRQMVADAGRHWVVR